MLDTVSHQDPSSSIRIHSTYSKMSVKIKITDPIDSRIAHTVEVPLDAIGVTGQTGNTAQTQAMVAAFTAMTIAAVTDRLRGRKEAASTSPGDEDDDSDSDFSVLPNELVTVPRTIKLHFTAITGKTTVLEVNPRATIQAALSLYQDREGVPPDQVKLIHGGRELKNKRTPDAVSQCKVSEEPVYITDRDSMGSARETSCTWSLR